MKVGIMVLFTSFSVLAPKAHCAFTASDFGFELQNGATATVNVSVTPLANGTIRYLYSVANSTSSRQPIFSYSVQIDSPVAKSDMASPPKWASRGCCYSDDKRTGATGIKVTGWIIDDDNGMIAPGASLFGYALTQAGVPGIKRFFVEGYTANSIPHFEGGSEEEELAVDNLADFFNNSTSGFTIGPTPVPASTDTGKLVDDLIALKHQSAELGWIGDAKFVLKLDKRLDQAKAALAGGKKKLARARLTQFIHELEKAHKEHGHDRDDDHRREGRDKRRDKKFATDEAYQLLKINAEFVIAKLPAKVKDRDEDKECREVEKEEEREDD